MTYEEFIHLFELCCDIAPECGVVKVFVPSKEYYKNLTIVKSSYTNIKQELKKLGIEKITGGVILDLGASYHQLTKRERGFSFSKPERRTGGSGRA